MTIFEENLTLNCRAADYNFGKLDEDTLQFLINPQNSRVLLNYLRSTCGTASPYAPTFDENKTPSKLILRKKVLNMVYDLSQINQYGTFLIKELPDEMLGMLSDNLQMAKDWCIREDASHSAESSF